MITQIKPLLASTLVFFSLVAALTAQDAKEIVRKTDEKARGNSSIAEMVITTERPKWTRSMDLKVWGKGTDYALILIQSPAKDKGVSFLKRKNEVWNWLPTLERTIKLPPSMMSESWMGTDFTNDDLVKEASIVQDYHHKLLGSETRAGRDCYKIEMIPKPDAAIIWGKLLIWIDKKEYIQLRTEFYDEDGELVNTMVGYDIENLGGRMLPTRMEMIPADKKGHKTTILYKTMKFDAPIADSFFTTHNMTKVK
ncbi:MAG: outer membrane lipoprotein-sorting protein [Bacteroidetes bacterium]|nr:MAG: outer membrane lipoprotein-sorting protein [Bacteroidota bacterium]